MCTTLYTFAKGMCTTLYTFLVYNVRFTLIVQCKLIITLVKIKKGMKKKNLRDKKFSISICLYGNGQKKKKKWIFS